MTSREVLLLVVELARLRCTGSLFPGQWVCGFHRAYSGAQPGRPLAPTRAGGLPALPFCLQGLGPR